MNDDLIPKKKRYCITKEVEAISIMDALRRERYQKPNQVFEVPVLTEEDDE